MIATMVKESTASCVFLVHPEIHKLKTALVEIEQMEIPVINIGKILSASLLDIQRNEQPRAIIRWFETGISSDGDHFTACWQIDLLFEPYFQLDPLALFRKAARFNRLIVLWPGDISNRILSYAVPEHRHFRTWRIDDPALNIVRLKD